MELITDRLLLRPWRRGDEAALVRHADNRKVWLGLQDRFPHPYTLQDAQRWIAFVEEQGDPPLDFAILFRGEPVGGVGLRFGEGVHRFTAELGYWLSESVWGQGLATEAAGRVADYAFGNLEVERLQAGVFAWNRSSARVLEKCGFVLEGRQARAVYKDGRFLDYLIYARLRARGEDSP